MEEKIEEVIEEVVEEVVDESVAQDTDNPEEPEAPELEAWQLTGEEEADDNQDDDDSVPVGKVIKMKERLKGKIGDRDDEISKLREELDSIKAGRTTETIELPPMPKATDYDSDEEHEEALEEWRDKKAEIRWNAKSAERKQSETVKQHQERIAKDVDAHYTRSAELVESSGIKAEHFKDADASVRQAVEAVMPKKGDGITDFIISVLGEGSEKVLFFLGRNKAARAEFQNLLVEDPDGNKAMVYLGQQKERLTNPQKRRSNAPKPATQAKGDETPNQSEKALMKKYREAHKNGKGQVAYNIKKKAKTEGHDVSKW
jgi:hypothetical protein